MFAMDGWLQDFRYACRGLRRNLGFISVVVLIIGLGIGTNTAVFSVIESVLLRSLPFAEPDRLVSVWTIPPNSSGKLGISGPEFQDYKEQSRSFEYIAEIAPRFTYTWTGHGEPRTVLCTATSPDFFPMLGVQPRMGRLYSPEEYHVDGMQVLISERFWREQLGGDPNVLGKVLNLDGVSQVVIGVIPSLPDLFPDTDIWAKMVPDFPWMRVRGNKFLNLMGRLKPGVSIEQAQNEMTAILRRGPGESQEISVQLTPLKTELVGKVKQQMQIVMAAVALVLLVTCVNVSYLLLARNSKRQGEVAIRLSIGASPVRILRQFILENFVLVFLGGLLGLMLSVQCVKLLAGLNLAGLPRSQTISLDGSVLMFALGVMLCINLFLAFAPSVTFGRLPIYAILKTGRGQSGNLGKAHFRFMLISEVSLTIILLVAAGLLLRSFLQVTRVQLGFRSDHLITSYLRTNDYPEGRKFFPELMRRTGELSGVQASAVSDCMPGTTARPASLKFEDRPNDPYNVSTVQGCWISADYFRAIGTPVLQGRVFTVRDDNTAPPVVIVNQALAQAYWPGESPIGKRIAPNYIGAGRNNSDVPIYREIVGVVANIRQKGIEGSVEPAVYMPYLQDQTNHVFAAMNWFVRTTADPRSLMGTIRPIVHQIRPNQPVEKMQTMEEGLFRLMSPRRFTLSLFASFAGLALFLSATGIFGMIAYSVSRRMPEMGVRMALGAQRGDIRQLVLREGLALTLGGIVLGCFIAAIFTRAMAGLLFGVKATDPLSFAGAILVLLVVAIVACLIPAWRAGSIDPMQALRME
jgi:putative ABC transport system permease protein